MRRLLVADRQFILLKLREATFGDAVRGSVPCPWPDCGQRVGVSFSTRDVPVMPSADKGPIYTCVLSAEAMAGVDEAGRTVGFRLPTGADQETLSPLLADGEASALTALLSSASCASATPTTWARRRCRGSRRSRGKRSSGRCRPWRRRWTW